MNEKNQHIELLAGSMEQLIVRMKEVDDRCVELHENITVRELDLIRYTDEKGKAKMSEIADYMDVPMSTATGIVDKLVAKKYLQRRHSEEDRRIVNIELADRGRDTAFIFKSMRQEIAERILTLLNEKEIKVFIALLEKITDGLNAFVEVD